MTPPAPPPSFAPAASPRLAWVALAGVVVVVAVLYLPALGYPFLDLDDVYGVVENPGIRNLSWEGIRFLFLEDQRDIRWFPLAYLSFAVDHAVGGLDAGVFHRTNLLLHLGNVVLVFGLIRRLSGDAWVALVTSAAFGIHPLQVESVAWVSSRKNVLFLFFFLLSVLAYLPHARRVAAGEGWAWGSLGASVLLFLLAVSAKSTAVSLPAVLVLVDHHLARRLPRSPLAFLAQSLPSKLPYLPVIALGWVMNQRLARDGPFGYESALGAWEWATISAHNLFFYVAKAIAPLRLGVFYPLPEAGPLPLRFPIFAVCGLALLALGIAGYRRRRDLVFGLGWYFATILPMALLPVLSDDIPLLAADRYFYQSSIGLFFLLGIAARASLRWTARRPAARAALVTAGLGLAVAWLQLAATHRSSFRGTLPLYQRAFAAHPSGAFGYRLALAHAAEGHMGSAFAMLEEAERAPDQALFARLFVHQWRIADLYRLKGDPSRAARFLAAAIDSTPNTIEPARTDTPLALRYLAELHERAGEHEPAARARERARRAAVDPSGYFESHWFRTAPQEARDFLERRVAAAPYDAVAWHYLGRWFQRFGEPERAKAALARAAELGFSLPASPRGDAPEGGAGA